MITDGNFTTFELKIIYLIENKTTNISYCQAKRK